MFSAFFKPETPFWIASEEGRYFILLNMFKFLFTVCLFASVLPPPSQITYSLPPTTFSFSTIAVLHVTVAVLPFFVVVATHINNLPFC